MGSYRAHGVAHAAEAGCYEAWRAAALSGVPTRTVYHWASTKLVVPSVSSVKEMLWSYADVMTLRVVAWLRQRKQTDDGVVRATGLKDVRRMLTMLDAYQINFWVSDNGTDGSSPILVDQQGRLYVDTGEGILSSRGQRVHDLPKETLRLLAPFENEGNQGPDLIRPRPTLRIIPLKVSGEPHVTGSRITSRSLAALFRRGMGPSTIAEMYELPAESVLDAIDLENDFIRYRERDAALDSMAEDV